MNVGESFAYEEYEWKSLLSISWVAHAFTSQVWQFFLAMVGETPLKGNSTTFLERDKLLNELWKYDRMYPWY